MRILNLNNDKDIGASGWFVDIEGYKLLMDAGSHPKRIGHDSLPQYSLIKGEDLDAVAISHCHHDHVGSLPLALDYFPRAHVLMTELSYFLIERILHNSVNVMKSQRDELGITDLPLYTHDELDDIAPRFQGFKYNREIEWAAFHKTRKGFLSPTLEFYDAGHALGSSGIMVRGNKQTVFYTGDVCFKDQTILRGARFEDVKADVLILETTRGGREVPEGQTREREIERLIDSIQRVFKRKGCVLIPVFALGRTQEMLAVLALMMRSGRLKRQPVFIGGLGRVFTEIYDLESHRTHRNHSNLILNENLDLTVLDKKQTEKIKLTKNRLFVLTAGMLTEKTAAHDIALRMLQEERHAIFFVGYTDPDTPGGRLRAAKHGETFHFSQSGGDATVNCEIDSFDLTAHADRDDLLDFVGHVAPSTVVLGHGSDDSRAWMAEQIKRRYPKIKIMEPGPGESIEV
ncbi:MAG: MBL fold metallo-hydrolase [Verrucomicrobia bacterium]|nr:MBL fold metallo-hydrolase [Verrucomicrobiota bacterium]MCF7707616.1 MBL fold metallo-hydrolase [Verrucomicrobiota bacterium]